jgi:hypothetical protein
MIYLAYQVKLTGRGALGVCIGTKRIIRSDTMDLCELSAQNASCERDPSLVTVPAGSNG